MNEYLLRKIAFTCSVIGLTLIFLLSNFTVTEKINIKTITSDCVGKSVKICGDVVNKYVSKNGHIFMNVADRTGKIKVVIFNQTASKIDTSIIGNKCCITGKVNIYKNELEIIANSIEKL